MCRQISFTGDTLPELDIVLFTPAVACKTCGSPVFVDEGEVLCLDCPLAINAVSPVARPVVRREAVPCCA